MNNLFVFILLFQLNNSLISQPQIKENLLHLTRQEDGTWLQNFDIAEIESTDFIAVSIRIEGINIDANTISGKMNTNKKWYEISPFGEDPLQENRFVSELMYLKPEEAGKIQISFTKKVDIDLSSATGKIRIFVPENIESSSLHTVHNSSRFFTCPCPQPDYIPRVTWGSGFRLTGDIFIPPATYTKVSHMIVHHSAGTNTSNNWSGVVASIFDFHVNTNGWQDVGYNWLIDPNGMIYEGRGGGDNVRGAHMCGYNNNSMGVCLLGNFVTTEPTNKMVTALTHLLSWKSCRDNISPSGGSNIVSYPGFMQHISGHRDGCAPNYTECPGTNLYSKLQMIRNATGQNIIEICGNISENQDFESKVRLHVIPNPVSDILKFRVENKGKSFNIKIIDITGRTVLAVSDVKALGELDISLINEGMYLFRVETEGKIFTARFIKK